MPLLIMSATNLKWHTNLFFNPDNHLASTSVRSYLASLLPYIPLPTIPLETPASVTKVSL